MVGISRHRQVVPAGDPAPVRGRPSGRAEEAEPGAGDERASRLAGTGTEAAPRNVPLTGGGVAAHCETWREIQLQESVSAERMPRRWQAPVDGESASDLKRLDQRRFVGL